MFPKPSEGHAPQPVSPQRKTWLTGCVAYRPWALLVLLAWVGLLQSGCRAWQVNDFQDRLTPSNDRDWSPEFSRTPTVAVQGEQITVHNIRNAEWLSEENFVLNYYDRTINVNDILGVDFVVVPFEITAIAHTMLSFQLADGTYLGISVEIRTEQDEDYSSILGAARQFEVTYLVADERDIIRRRTRHLNADVYIYPTTATPQQARMLFLDIGQRMNELAVKPEFYHTLVNNCTTNIVSHVNRLNPSRIPYSIGVLLPGLADKYAYKLGILDNSVPFETLKQAAHVNNLAAQYYDDPQFSQKIRAGRQQMVHPEVDSAQMSSAAQTSNSAWVPASRVPLTR